MTHNYHSTPAEYAIAVFTFLGLVAAVTAAVVSAQTHLEVERLAKQAEHIDSIRAEIESETLIKVRSIEQWVQAQGDSK